MSYLRRAPVKSCRTQQIIEEKEEDRLSYFHNQSNPSLVEEVILQLKCYV